jgi:hypothetical protein
MTELTDDETRKEELAAEAAHRIKSGQHWTDWMMVGDGLMVGRHKAMYAAGTNAPKGKGYAKAFSRWMSTRPWALDLDNPTRNDLFWCVDRRSEIEAWRDTLAQNERARINHPSSMKRRFEATHKIKTDGDDDRPVTATRYQKLEREFEQVATERDQLKKRLDSSDGSLFDLRKDKASDIAEITFQHLGLARTRGIRDALTKLLKREEDALRKQSKQAG